MKHYTFGTSGCVLSLLVALLAGAPWNHSSADLLRVGIGPTKVGKSLTDDMQRRGKTTEMGRVTEALDAQFTSAFTQTRKFEVIARTDLQTLLDREQGLPVGTVIDPETAAATGKIKGLQYMVIISVDSFLDTTEKLDVTANLGVRMIKRRVQLSCVATINDCSTGKLLDAPTFQFEKTFPVPIQQNETSSGERTDELLIKIVREMAESMANRVVDVLLPPKILRVGANGKTLTINRGDGGGMKVDDSWELYGPTQEDTDPDTGKVIKTKGDRIGTVRITTVDAESSQGELIELVPGTAAAKGCVLSRPPVKKDAPGQ